MSERLFLVNVEPPEIRVAEVVGGRLQDLDVERDGRMLGNIYKGRVENVLPGMDAAFVDIGQKRNALLYVGDVASDGSRGTTISDLLKSGQDILVQVARPAVGGKGARVTTRLSLPGRYGILISNSETAGISKRIESEEERGRLRRIADKLRPLDHGFILRTEAEGATEAHIAGDANLLVKQMNLIRERAAVLKAPVLVHRDLGLLGRLARDRFNGQVDGVFIDSLETLERFREQLMTFAPELSSRVRHHASATPIFQEYGVESEVQSALQRSVPLPRGGTLIIDEAEALTAIDVNTGSFVGRKGLGDTVLATNLDAVEEIARQLRLRDIGGIVVIDFIDMERTRDRVKVLNTLEAALREDRAKTRIVQISPSGLVEMTRRRETQSLRALLNEPCPHCNGLGFIARPETIAIDARRRVRELALRHQDEGVLVRMHPEVACAFLGDEAEMVKELENSTGGRISVRVDPDLDHDTVHFDRIVPGQALKRDLVPGTIVPIDSGTQTYPAGSPQFVVVAETLVLIPGLAELKFPDKKHTVHVIIAGTGPHFASGRLAGSAVAKA